ncbi:hypothetical protein Trydic_g10911 [Trypoxylus dichotomus]
MYLGRSQEGRNEGKGTASPTPRTDALYLSIGVASSVCLALAALVRITRLRRLAETIARKIGGLGCFGKGRCGNLRDYLTLSMPLLADDVEYRRTYNLRDTLFKYLLEKPDVFHGCDP